MVNSLELIKEHEAQLANVFGMLLVVFKPAAKTACGEEYLAGFGTVAVGLFAREGVVGNLLKEAFAKANTGDTEAPDIEVACNGKKNDGGDAHDIGAVAADTVGFHALPNVALEDAGKPLAKKRDFQ